MVDAHDDAQLIADQYRRLEGSINEILVSDLSLGILLRGDTHFKKVGSVLRAEAKLAVRTVHFYFIFRINMLVCLRSSKPSVCNLSRSCR